MKYVLNEKDLDKWFVEGAHLMARLSIGDTGYDRDVLKVRTMTRRGSGQDVYGLVTLLRPWNIETEGNWSGREFVRFAAMQGLTYLGKCHKSVEAMLGEIARSDAPEWREYDERLRIRWSQWADASCLEDPYNDFLRCLREVLDCIAEPDESG